MPNLAQWAVVPTIAPWRGDMRRNASPYVLTGGVSYSSLNIANFAMSELRKRGISCHLEMVFA